MFNPDVMCSSLVSSCSSSEAVTVSVLIKRYLKNSTKVKGKHLCLSIFARSSFCFLWGNMVEMDPSINFHDGPFPVVESHFNKVMNTSGDCFWLQFVFNRMSNQVLLQENCCSEINKKRYALQQSRWFLPH